MLQSQPRNFFKVYAGVIAFSVLKFFLKIFLYYIYFLTYLIPNKIKLNLSFML
jgi:hypothetical protein